MNVFILTLYIICFNLTISCCILNRTPSQSNMVMQPAPVSNPFGTLPAMPQMSIGNGGSSPSVQYGISSLPVSFSLLHFLIVFIEQVGDSKMGCRSLGMFGTKGAMSYSLIATF